MGNESSSSKPQSAGDASIVMEGNANPAEGVGGFTPPPTETTSEPAAPETKKVEYGEGDHTPLFGDESKPSVEELTGYDAEKAATDEEKPAESAPKAEEGTTDKDGEGDKHGEEPSADEEAKKADTKSEDDKSEKTDEKPAEDGKTDSSSPPKGFVPLQALQEERKFRQAADKKISDLTGEVSNLKAQLAGRKEGDPPVDPDSPFKDFEVLSPEKEAELKEESTVDYVEYMAKKQDFQKWQEKQEAQLSANKQEAERIIGAAMNSIEAEMPGFYQNDQMRIDLAQHASDFGLPLESLLVVSNPGTLLTDPNIEGNLIMGDIASDIVTYINRTRNKISELEKAAPADEKSLTAQIERRVRAELTEEFAGHFKKARSEDEFRSLASVTESAASTPEEKTPAVKILGEDELAALSPEQRDEYMRTGVVPA